MSSVPDSLQFVNFLFKNVLAFCYHSVFTVGVICVKVKVVPLHLCDFAIGLIGLKFCMDNAFW